MRKLNGLEADPERIANSMHEVFADPNGDVLGAEMAEAGIAHTQIMPLDLDLDLGLELDECPVSIERKNRLIADITKRHPGTIGAFCGVSLFEKAVRQWGMKGLKLDPAAGFYANDRLVYPYYEKAVELKVPVLVHTGAAIPPFRNKYCEPIYLDDVTLDFPELVVVAVHAAFGWWQQLAFLISKKTNLMADLSGWQVTANKDYGLFCCYLRDMLSIGGGRITICSPPMARPSACTGCTINNTWKPSRTCRIRPLPGWCSARRKLTPSCIRTPPAYWAAMARDKRRAQPAARTMQANWRQFRNQPCMKPP